MSLDYYKGLMKIKSTSEVETNLGSVNLSLIVIYLLVSEVIFHPYRSVLTDGSFGTYLILIESKSKSLVSFPKKFNS